MSRLGADPDALEDVAAELTAFAGRVDGSRSSVAAVLGGLRWTGADAHGFRRSWDSRGNADLAVLGGELRSASRQLRAEAFQQRMASAADAGQALALLGGGTRSALTAAGIDPSRWYAGPGAAAGHALGAVGNLGAVDAGQEDGGFRLLGGMIGAVGRGEDVGQSLLDGSKTLFGAALQLTEGRTADLPWGGAREGVVGGAGALLGLASTGISSGFDRYHRDRDLDLPASERALRVSVHSGLHMAAGTLGAVVSTKVGAVIGGPVGAAVGAKVGAVVGAKFGAVVGGKLGAVGLGMAIDHGVDWAMSSDVATAAVDHAVDLASDVYHDVGAGLSAAHEGLTAGASNAVDAVGGAVDSLKGFFR